ncbi:hypothetical protein NG895_21680 [Aeoliella sp. ICT_H6.2]|uniref:Uncharacterized protein n=1 Tax=Aeoliella straminimaris TaxID=2954799 RepID=A0A9X2FCH0_9BACT|nr:hypothetical protein [Aeoliella straminimaris]MCO6046517.1 hypothetical protein [Aeoliella straminimaris]
MFRKLLGTMSLVFAATIATSAAAEESLWSKLCDNEVPDCICRWCCPSYCRKPEPRVCGPLPPDLTCGPRHYTPYWCRQRAGAGPCDCDPGCSSAIGATFLKQPRSMNYALERDTRALPVVGPKLDTTQKPLGNRTAVR